MATLGSNTKTIFDWAKEKDPEGKFMAIVELLSQSNEILTDMRYKECNNGTSERITQRTGLPTVYWRLINQGVPISKATSAQVDETTGMLTARSHIDRELVKLNGNSAEFRLNESMAFLEAMNQEMAQTLFYGSNANPEEFVGLANRYNDTTAANGQNILLAGGAGADNASVWLVGWGDRSFYGIFPKGTQAGLSHEDLGEDDVLDGSNNTYRVLKDLYEWHNGIALRDWRYVVRIANIDISDLAGLTGTQATTASTFITKLMSRAVDRLPSMAGITPVFYANRSVLSLLRIAAQEKASSVLAIEEGLNQFGQNIFEVRFNGIPVRMVDSLTIAESLVA